MERIKHITIAVVDDHKLLRNEVCRLLEDMGFQVLLQAENGRAALEKMKECRQLPDICLLDVNMPVMNGFETAKALSDGYPEIKIMAFSTGNEEMYIRDMLQSGAKGYIAKGGHPEELKHAIEALYENGYYLKTVADKMALNDLNSK